MICNHCVEGFLNIGQLPSFILPNDQGAILNYIHTRDGHDISVCNCCGTGENWHGEAGYHTPADYGPDGPYSYNGGLPECY